MGILDRILARTPEEPVGAGIEGLIKLSGTTTMCRDAIVALAGRHAAANDGYLELNGSLQREPENPIDPNAVAVLVEGDRVGYLPSYLASETRLSQSGSESVRVQIFTEMLPKGLRAEAWAWLGRSHPQWEWSRTHRPPMSSSAKAAEEHARTRGMVQDALAGGGTRAAAFAAGMVNGVHYLELIEPIKQLKREGRLEEALVLCHAAIRGAEGSRVGGMPAPFYTEQAAIILRKLGRRDDEIAVLKRWLTLCPPEHREASSINTRLIKLEPRS